MDLFLSMQKLILLLWLYIPDLVNARRRNRKSGGSNGPSIDDDDDDASDKKWTLFIVLWVILIVCGVCSVFMALCKACGKKKDTSRNGPTNPMIDGGGENTQSCRDKNNAAILLPSNRKEVYTKATAYPSKTSAKCDQTVVVLLARAPSRQPNYLQQ